MTSVVTSTADWIAARVAEVERAVVEAVDGADRVALVGFPRYRNAGDAAIWIGAKSVLQRIGVAVAYQADDETYDPAALRRRVGSAPILVTGGGNLGTLWPRQHGFRETVIREHGHQRILQLSQSAHFADDRSLGEFGRLVAAHGDVWLHLRDEASHTCVAEVCPGATVRLVPDLALATPVPSLRQTPVEPVLWIGRSDVEQADHGTVSATRVLDWADRDAAPRAERLLLRTIRRSRHLIHGPVPGADRLARRRVVAAMRAIAGAETVVTSRLHGHILSMLVGRPHVVIADRNGKIPGFASTWGSDELDLVRFADPADDAASVARAFRDPGAGA